MLGMDQNYGINMGLGNKFDLAKERLVKRSQMSSTVLQNKEKLFEKFDMHQKELVKK